MAARGETASPPERPPDPPQPAPVEEPLPSGSIHPAFVALAFFGFAVAGTLRFWGLGEVGFNTDEAVYTGQAAALLRVEELAPYFPVLRAHPLFFHLILAGVSAIFGLNDVVSRAVSSAFGIGTIFATYLAAREFYGNRVALVAALLIAFMPYHLVVSRQVLLDGPAAFWATLSLCCLARFGRTERPAWVVAAAGLLGLSVLSKETAFVFSGAMYVFFASRTWPTLTRGVLLASVVVLFGLTLCFPLTGAVAGEASRGQSYLAWQLLRRANHTWYFYFVDVAPHFGLPILIAFVAAFPVLWVRRSWKEGLLVLWIVAPLSFFTIWPVKGFPYLLPLTPAVAILAARALESLRTDFTVRVPTVAYAALVGAACVGLLFPSYALLRPSPSGTFLAGSGGVIGGRETALWVGENVPEGATLMAIGPSLANVIQFYGHRRTLGISVSPNPLHRNPQYTPVENPDFAIRRSEIQYIVWDTYSASRSPFFSQRLLDLAKRYNGREVYRYERERQTPDGPETFPITIVYEVRP